MFNTTRTKISPGYLLSGVSRGESDDTVGNSMQRHVKCYMADRRARLFWKVLKIVSSRDTTGKSKPYSGKSKPHSEKVNSIQALPEHRHPESCYITFDAALHVISNGVDAVTMGLAVSILLRVVLHSTCN